MSHINKGERSVTTGWGEEKMEFLFRGHKFQLHKVSEFWRAAHNIASTLNNPYWALKIMFSGQISTQVFLPQEEKI